MSKRNISYAAKKRILKKNHKKLCKKSQGKNLQIADASNLPNNQTQEKPQSQEKNEEKSSSPIFAQMEENMKKYGNSLSLKNYNDYGRCIINNSLNESVPKKILTEKILQRYNITVEHRKEAIKILWSLIINNKIDMKCLYYSINIFDQFLIIYSEDNPNNEKCQNFFRSKIDNSISRTKICLLMFCCYYLSFRMLTSKLITVDQILCFQNAKEEFSKDELNSLIFTIEEKTVQFVSPKNIYSLLTVYKFNLSEIIRDNINENFWNSMNNIINFCSLKTYQYLDLVNINDSQKALGAIIFSYYKMKSDYKQYGQILDSCFLSWCKELSINYTMKGVIDSYNWLADKYNKEQNEFYLL